MPCVKSPPDVLVSNAIPALLNYITVKSDIEQQLGQSTTQKKAFMTVMSKKKEEKKKSHKFFPYSA